MIIRFVFGFTIGLILGAAAVLLTAPQSGSDLQQSVRNRVDEVMAEGRRAAAQRRAELTQRLADLQTS